MISCVAIDTGGGKVCHAHGAVIGLARSLDSSIVRYGGTKNSVVMEAGVRRQGEGTGRKGYRKREGKKGREGPQVKFCVLGIHPWAYANRPGMEDQYRVDSWKSCSIGLHVGLAEFPSAQL